ncbi:MAG TPA: hypothetical protein VK588_06920 [Chitinophagaceae bacterium]|nr:hypothetical protein [Chitinophagaceae bacterium]
MRNLMLRIVILAGISSISTWTFSQNKRQIPPPPPPYPDLSVHLKVPQPPLPPLDPTHISSNAPLQPPLPPPMPPTPGKKNKHII